MKIFKEIQRYKHHNQKARHNAIRIKNPRQSQRAKDKLHKTSYIKEPKTGKIQKEGPHKENPFAPLDQTMQ